MNRITAVVAGLSLAFVGTSTTIAATINVPGDQPTIAAAISASVNGDVINIAAGTYYEHSLNPGGKAITIQGTAYGHGVIATTIDAQQGGNVFVLQSNEGSGTIIQDLIVTGGLALQGGGFYLSDSSPTIIGCRITGNTASNGEAPPNEFGSGGGIWCYNSSPTITDCTISNNTAAGVDGGGGFASLGGTPNVTGCVISGNTPNNILGGSAASLRGETGLSIITLENSTICGTGEHISGVLIEHRGENHISDCIDEGDLNGDGTVDAADLTALHEATGICRSDVDHNGVTDVNDLLRLVKDGWGGHCP